MCISVRQWTECSIIRVRLSRFDGKNRRPVVASLGPLLTQPWLTSSCRCLRLAASMGTKFFARRAEQCRRNASREAAQDHQLTSVMGHMHQHLVPERIPNAALSATWISNPSIQVADLKACNSRRRFVVHDSKRGSKLSHGSGPFDVRPHDLE